MVNYNNSYSYYQGYLPYQNPIEIVQNCIPIINS